MKYCCLSCGKDVNTSAIIEYSPTVYPQSQTINPNAAYPPNKLSWINATERMATVDYCPYCGSTEITEKTPKKHKA
jgi:DNA-directed RNA polymerase subunit RPC12/RpoP